MKSTENNDIQNTLRLSTAWIPFITQTRRIYSHLSSTLNLLYLLTTTYNRHNIKYR